jgi:hypothetical protein
MSSLPEIIMDKIKHLSGEKSASKPILRESTRKKKKSRSDGRSG